MAERRPIERFEDDVRPALLMLQLYRLLDCDDTPCADEIVGKLRALVGAKTEEDLFALRNEIFLGLVRERSGMPRSSFRKTKLAHLLRQAIVGSCTALETFLPALLLAHLPEIIRIRGRDFVPGDDQTRGYFKEMTFSLDELLRAAFTDDGPLFLANKLKGFLQYKYLAGPGGVRVVASMLGVPRVFDVLGQKLARDRKDLTTTLDITVSRRNDIVHRGDRPVDQPSAEPAEIGYAFAKQGVETIVTVCHGLNEIIDQHMAAVRTPSAERVE